MGIILICTTRSLCKYRANVPTGTIEQFLINRKNVFDKATELCYNGSGGLTRLRSFGALLTQAPVAWRSSLSLTMKSAVASSCLHALSLACPHAIACVSARIRSLMLVLSHCAWQPFGCSSSDYRPAVHILRMRVSCGSRRPHSCSDYRPALSRYRSHMLDLSVCAISHAFACSCSHPLAHFDASVAPTITNASLLSRATTPAMSIEKGESSPFQSPLNWGNYRVRRKIFIKF